MRKRSRLMAAATLALAFAYPAFAADPASQSGMSDEISALKARLEQLEVKQKQEDAQRRDAAAQAEQTQTAFQLSRDVQTHEQLLSAEGFTAGYNDNRFTIQSNDGKFVFRPWMHLQFRGVAMNRTDFAGTGDGIHDQNDIGFEVRRLKLGFDGNMFTPDLTYMFNWATSRASSNASVKSSAGATVGTVSNNAGGSLFLEEAWVKYHIPTTPFYIKGGQIKDPLLHDQIVSSRYQQSTERSLTADFFANGDAFTEGITFIYDPQKDVRVEAGVTHGMRSANTNFIDYPENGGLNQYNYGLAGRIEYKAMGRWKDYSQIGAVGTTERLLVFGLGADFSERGHANQTVVAADFMYGSPSGLSIYGAFVDRYTNHNFGFQSPSGTGASIGTPDPLVADRATNEYSVLLQAGFMFDKQIEPFGRYEFMKLQGTAAGSDNWINVITAGVNYYMYGHRLKLTGEVIWLPNGTPVDDGGGDILTNLHGNSELTFVAQLQLLL